MTMMMTKIRTTIDEIEMKSALIGGDSEGLR
jgi:hypothetical protein